MASSDRNITRLQVRQGTTPQGARCRFCQRANPDDARYCNGCGAPLDVVRCGACGAVNDGAAATCGTCGEVLAKRQSDDLFLPLPPQASVIPGVPAPGMRAPGADSDPSAAAPLFLLDEPVQAETQPAAAPEPRAAQPSNTYTLLAIVALAALAIGAALAFLAYRPSGPTQAAAEAPPAPQAQSSSTVAAPAAASTSVPPAPATASTATRTAPPGESERTPAAAAETAGQLPVRQVAPPAPPAKRAVIERARPEVPKSKVRPCTEAIAALGLCTLDAPQRKEP